MITKVGKKYKLDIRPDGAQGKRVIRLFDTKNEAVRYQYTLVSRLSDTKAVQAKSDDRHLPELIQIWFDLHGRSLKSAVDTKNRLLKLSELLGNPEARLIDTESLAKYRKIRLDQGLLPSTLNREFITLKSMFRELKRMSVIGYESSILTVRKLRETKAELSYLTNEQIQELSVQVESSKNDSLKFVVLICLVTGARWSEAEGLTSVNCINRGFQFVDTKNGYSRFVPVEESIFVLVQNRLIQKPFDSCYSAYRSAFKRSGITSPPGQLAHILRHTFASHFIMNGGNIVALQKILGHSSLNVTMRYSHLSPDYLIQAVQLNPLSGINKSGRNVEIIPADIKKAVD
jgi:integrase